MADVDKSTVLVVDDRPENLLAMERLLEQPELGLLMASNGNDALALMLEHEVALVLLDVQMPGMSGYEVAQLMRMHERTKRIPIIFITAFTADEEHVFKGYETGAVDYVFKPFNANILRSKVAVFCELHRYHRLVERQLKEIETKNALLQKQLDEIRVLRGLLPVCSNCKKVRNDSGYWEEMEKYVRQHSEVRFSHSVCPECIKELYPELDDAEEEERP